MVASLCRCHVTRWRRIFMCRPSCRHIIIDVLSRRYLPLSAAVADTAHDNDDTSGIAGILVEDGSGHIFVLLYTACIGFFFFLGGGARAAFLVRGRK